MKIVILGGGVIGVTSAWYLAAAGHEVTLLDRQPGPALETSFANAGEISPGYASPWAAPGIPVKAIKWMLMRHSPLLIHPSFDAAFWRFGVAMLRNCTAARYAVNKSRMVPIAEYSHDMLKALRAGTGVAYDARTQGTLQLFRTEKLMAGAAKDQKVLDALGVPNMLLDPEGCVAAEPALARVRERFVGGLRLPNDETGDCFKFTNALRDLAAARGAEFRHGVKIERIVAEGGRVAGVATSAGLVTGDAYVLALGSHSPLMLREHGIDLPVYPVKGYSLTVPITDPSGAPQSTVMDEKHKVAITRLGDRIRVGGMAELDGYSTELHPNRRATLEHVVSDLYPAGGDAKAGSFWAGHRPMTPDGPPVIGRAKYPNLWLNTGHGTLGWTMACGSGAVLADLVSGRAPEIDARPLGLDRYSAVRGARFPRALAA
ncbi:D-amino acid dehydrogenase [Amaricoccus solimangrovi]|uniref:D-amino acid dehydrogenase n=1 Tax=Amaricoccus solimangrovi TaxID=2589815 RepID=A0A501WRG2_9RHOB|nr:D-amino acid dehydrogenase [Amaricoccus solimangrovi]TPE50960.1 D-amino acid dehydrogenase [Amaricoccus solimangrovi]